VDADLVAYDPEYNSIYVLRWFNHCPPMNSKHAVHCEKTLNELDSEVIRAQIESDYFEAVHKKQPETMESTVVGIRGSERWPVMKGAGRRAGRG
jgi:hypothetical protein